MNRLSARAVAPMGAVSTMMTRFLGYTGRQMDVLTIEISDVEGLQPILHTGNGYWRS
jgi:hypothetical protein